MIEVTTVYFPNTGSENTEEVLRIVKLRAEQLGIKTIVVASATGNTAVKAVDALQWMRIIAVSRITGFREPNTQEFTEENKQKVEIKGGKVLTCTHTFSGVSQAMRKKFNTYLLGDIIANTLRVFGQGTKVACEVAIMAADAGLVRTDEDIIAMGGTSRGIDTALVVRPVNSMDFFDLKVKETLCKPRL